MGEPGILVVLWEILGAPGQEALPCDEGTWEVLLRPSEWGRQRSVGHSTGTPGAQPSSGNPTTLHLWNILGLPHGGSLEQSIPCG